MVGRGQLGTPAVSGGCKESSSESCPQAEPISSCATRRSWWMIRSFPGKSKTRMNQGGWRMRGWLPSSLAQP